MAERLVVVEEAFVARGPGVLVAPRITLTRPAQGPFAVRLRFPDGAERAAKASFDVAHIRGPLPPFAMVRLLDCTPGDVPAGTEIWTED
ncbi:MAG: hypothetical protein ACLQVI_25130 [Polyangiaceae bacterium]|jgi:hypothetical protein